MDWAVCKVHAQAVLLMHPTFQDLQQHPRIQGYSAAFQVTQRKKHVLAPVLQVLFSFSPRWQWAVTPVQLFIPRQGLGRAFPGHGSILISFWVGEVEPYTKISQGRHQPPPPG